MTSHQENLVGCTVPYVVQDVQTGSVWAGSSYRSTGTHCMPATAEGADMEHTHMQVHHRQSVRAPSVRLANGVVAGMRARRCSDLCPHSASTDRFDLLGLKILDPS